MNRKLILLGIDGANWGLVDSMISQGGLPKFQWLLSRSYVDTLHSTVPALSPPSWTSMFTGVNPGKHGIVDFLLREKGGFVPCLSRYRMCKTIWRILSDSGKKCIVINEPMTYPPERIDGIMTTGLLTPPGSENWIHPSGLREEMNRVAGGYECDISPDFLTILSEDRRKGAQMLEELAVKVFKVSKYAASNYDCDLLAVIFTATDRLQHYWWNDLPEITRHYQMLDKMLGEYIEFANTWMADLIVVSDHGFGPRRSLFRINDWLKESGLAVYRGSVLSKGLVRIGITRSMFRNILGDWPTAFRILPAPLQEMIRSSLPEKTETAKLDSHESIAHARSPAGVFVSDEKWLSVVTKQLRELTDKGTGGRIFEIVAPRDQMIQGPYAYRAPDILLQPSFGYDVSVAGSDAEARRVGVHRPEGIFLHYRPDSNSPSDFQVISDPIRPWDVAACVLQVLGVSTPDYFDGRSKIRT